jgi:hypothetical protein
MGGKVVIQLPNLKCLPAEKKQFLIAGHRNLRIASEKTASRNGYSTVTRVFAGCRHGKGN